MPRVKGGTVTRRRRKRVLKLAKGYYGAKSTLFRTAKQQVMKSFMYAYRDRRQVKRDFRKLWITRINAAARLNGISYSRLMYGLKVAGIEVNRKMLADLAIHDEKAFSDLASRAKENLVK
jgi:large subunit ribosomal protein L20